MTPKTLGWDVLLVLSDLPLGSEARKQVKDTLFRNPLAPVFAHHEELCHGIDTLVRLTDFSDQSEPRRTARSP